MALFVDQLKHKSTYCTTSVYLCVHACAWKNINSSRLLTSPPPPPPPHIRDSSVVRAPDLWLYLCWLFFWYPFHPRVTAVARKRPRSFRQKCRWQVTAKHAYTLRTWLCMKWHGAWLYGVNRTCAEMAAVSCGTSHASAVSTPLWWIFKKTRYKKLVTHVAPHASAVSLLKRAENSAI